MATTKDFKPERDLPHLKGQVILVTGGTAGLGRGSVLSLLKLSPAEVVLSGRNVKRAEAIVAEAKAAAPSVTVSFLEMDLTSLDSVQAGARKFLESHDRLDVLMNNAGVMATEKGVTKAGYEVQFGTNHVGPALLTKLLLPLLEATAAAHPNSGARIVNLSSIAYKQAPSSGIEFATLRSPQTKLGVGLPFAPMTVWYRYGQSKLANLLYAKALAKHHPTVTTVAVHPGVIATDLFHGVTTAAKPAALAIQLFGSTASVEEGFYNQVWASAIPKDQLQSGAYYEPVGVKTTPVTRRAKDEELAEKLWTWTQDELKEFS